MKEIIINKENAHFQELLALKTNRQKRRQMSQFIVESVAALRMMIRSGYKAEEIIASDGKKLSDWAKDAVINLTPGTIVRLNPDLMKKLSDRGDSPEIIALCRTFDRTLSGMTLNAGSVILLVDKPSNPGNLGSIIRACNAFGIQAVITTGHCVDHYDPAVIRSSLGAFFATPVVYEPSKEVLTGWLTKQKSLYKNLKIIGTDSKGPIELKARKFSPPLVICIGNEAAGLSRKISDIADEIVSIPINGNVDSLNAACAASIVIYEVMSGMRN